MPPPPYGEQHCYVVMRPRDQLHINPFTHSWSFCARLHRPMLPIGAGGWGGGRGARPGPAPLWGRVTIRDIPPLAAFSVLIFTMSARFNGLKNTSEATITRMGAGSIYPAYSTADRYGRIESFAASRAGTNQL